MTDLRVDLVTFGEALIRLTPPAFQRLEQAHTLDVHVGGSELNVAVGVARLGLRSRWVTRLTDNALGRLIGSRAREHGVDVSRIEWTRDDRVSVSFHEHGAAPRPPTVLDDRGGSALSRIQPGTIDWRKSLRGARWLHTSGITPALSIPAAAVTGEALQTAREAGLTVSYALAYRSSLWTPEQARKIQTPLMDHVDILIGSEEDVRAVFGVKTGRGKGDYALNENASPAEMARSLRDRFGFKAVAITLRETPKVWLNTWGAIVHVDGETYEGPRYEVEVVDRIGVTDAFAAGFIFGALMLRGWDAALRYGTALSALKHTVPGDFSVVTREEVEQLLRGGSLRVVR